MSVANCGHDEAGKYSGGKAGDQSGTEWYIRQWYNFGQNVVLIHPDQKVNDLVADLAVEGAENDLVGYDQGERTTFYTALKAAEWRPSKITTACEGDCSSGVAAIVQAAGHLLGDAKLQGVSKDCYTGNLRAALVAAGYKAYTDSKYLTGESYLPRGAINLNESKHVNVEVTGGANASNPTAPAPQPAPAAKVTVSDVQTWMNKTYGYLLAVDNKFGPDSKKHAIMVLQTEYNKQYGENLAIDGKAGPLTQAAWSRHNIRQGAKGNITRMIQGLLYAKGYDPNGFDSSFGPGCAAAVGRFQAANGLSDDKVVGKNTFVKLVA